MNNATSKTPKDKAIFKIPEFNKSSRKANINALKDYAVQINPEKLDFSYQRVPNLELYKPLTDANNEDKSDQRAVTPRYILQTRLTMTLEIDLVDKYSSLKNKAKQKVNSIKESASIISSSFSQGFGSGVKSMLSEPLKPVGLSDIDLFSERADVCIFDKLKTAAEYKLPIEFIWGGIRFPGRIESLVADIKYFSPEWNALQASIDITIKKTENI